MMRINFDWQNRNSSEGKRTGLYKNMSPRNQLKALVAGDNGTLEGLVVNLRDTKPYGAEDAREFVDMDLLAQQVPGLSDLAQLMLGNTRAASQKEFDTSDEAIALYRTVARTAARVVPQLRYINVYQKYWRIWRREGKEDGDPVEINLEELEDREIMDVELFRTHRWRKEKYPSELPYH